MEFLKFYLEIKFFFVCFLISSTAGWSKGLIFINFPKSIVSNIKNINNSPRVSSFLLLIIKLLKGIFFLKTCLVALNWENEMSLRFLFFK